MNGASSLRAQKGMVSAPGKKAGEELPGVPHDVKHLAVYPLAVPYLLNPVGMTILIIASDAVASLASILLVIALVLLVGALDYWVFTNIDKLSKQYLDKDIYPFRTPDMQRVILRIKPSHVLELGTED